MEEANVNARGPTAEWIRYAHEDVVRLSNGAASVLVRPHRGADLLSFRLVNPEYELLWRSPRSDRLLANASTLGGTDSYGFYDNYPGGMQELFPNAGPAVSVDGCPIPMHGEACRIPWDATLGDGAAVVCETETARYPCSLRRVFTLSENYPVLRIDASITNRAAQRLPAMWAFHPVYSDALVGPRTRLYLPADHVVSHAEPFGRNQQFEPGSDVAWTSPSDGGFAIGAGPDHSADLLYLSAAAGWYVLHNPDSGLALTVTWPVEMFRYVWLWREWHDIASWPWFGEHRIVGVEMHTSMPAEGLAAAMANGTALWLEPSETVAATLHFRIDHVGASMKAAGSGEPPVFVATKETSRDAI